ncbi:PqqD family protein, HPr-rel-A system [Sphingomonas sp. YR710]|jgi:PqqD family protein of HPr-rel-A system|nr:PqqD family protein, HPr-rel-A system [Sphingomonas sp. YR710]
MLRLDSNAALNGLGQRNIERSTSLIYRTDSLDACVVTRVEGLVLLYHRPSGATHLLNSPAPEILDLLAAEPCDAATLTRRLCETLGASEDEDALMVVSARLGELAEIGLVSAH